MSKFINKDNFTPVPYGSEGYKELSGFTELNAEVSRKGEIRICISGGAKKVGASKKLYTALGEPTSVKVLMNATQAAFRTVPDGTPGAFEFGKGAMIYSTDLAEKIMSLASTTEFKDNATTRCGRIDTIQTDEDDFTTVLLSFD